MTIGPLDDLAAMRRLGVACGIEDEGRDDEGVLAAWGAFVGDRLVGALCLERHDELDTPNWLAVDHGYRRRGLAAALYAELEREAVARGIPQALGHGASAGLLPGAGVRAGPAGSRARRAARRLSAVCSVRAPLHARGADQTIGLTGPQGP